MNVNLLLQIICIDHWIGPRGHLNVWGWSERFHQLHCFASSAFSKICWKTRISYSSTTKLQDIFSYTSRTNSNVSKTANVAYKHSELMTKKNEDGHRLLVNTKASIRFSKLSVLKQKRINRNRKIKNPKNKEQRIKDRKSNIKNQKPKNQHPKIIICWSILREMY